MTNERKLRPATPAEQEFHDRFLERINDKVSALAEKYGGIVPPFEMIPIINDIDNTVRRMGWRIAGSGQQVMIDEEMVWKDIQAANPIHDDILDINDNELFRNSYNTMSNLFDKLGVKYFSQEKNIEPE